VVQCDRHLPDGGQALGPNELLFGRRQRFFQLASTPDTLEDLRQQFHQGRVLGEIIIRPAAEC
jgi:hypothetical protein